MAWTTPRTWVTDEVVTAALLNQQIKDNLLVLSAHAHSGAAGNGSNTLTGVTFSSINSLIFADQSANPSVNGTIQRNGTELLYFDGTTAQNLTQADGTAGTAMLRSLGTSATTAAAGNHTHNTTFAFIGTTLAQNAIEVGRLTNTPAWVSVAAATHSAGAATSREVIVMTAAWLYEAATKYYEAGYSLRVTRAGSVVTTWTGLNSAVQEVGYLTHQPDSTSAIAYGFDILLDAAPGSGRYVNCEGAIRAVEVSGTEVTA
jgi:hypothetical protein